MAGTPDRSEKQTPGEDPRLAVARDEPAAPQGVDQATAVFSVRDADGGSAGSADDGDGDGDGDDGGTADAADAASSPAGPSASSEDAGDAGDAADAGDARLRAAVAAWVSGGTPPVPQAREGGAPDAEPEDGAGQDERPEGGPAADAPESGAQPEQDALPKRGAKDAAGADAKSDDAADAEAEAQPPAGAEPEPADKADAEPQTGAEPETGDGADAEQDAGPEAADAESGAQPQADGAPKADAEPETDAEPDAQQDAEPETGAGADAEQDAGPEAADADAVADESGTATAAGADAEADAQPQADGAPKADAEPETDAKPDAQQDAAPKTDAEPEQDAETDGKPDDSTGEDKTEAEGKADDKTEAEGKGKGKGKGGVDQATAVFRAVAPPQVDQPTAMLKLPASPDAGDAGEKPGKGERDVERTSTFVPLKRTDGPAPAQPPVPEAPERTTQQPLPPKPPLDLLAELTNTPPPPETGVRTAVRRVKIWTPLVILLIIAFAIVQAVRPLPTPSLELTAQETVKFDGARPDVPWPTQGQAAMDVNGIGTFGTSGDQKPVPIASIAKVMTVYLILRDHPIKPGADSPKIRVDAAAQKHYETGKAEQESVVKVTEGQNISEYEALQAVMLPSANNIAKLLARWDSGSSSEDAFVEKMNKTAKELGMKNTHYTDPSGLDKTTVSTAEDLVKLARAAMENATFRDLARQPSYIDSNGDKQNNFFGLVPTVAIGIKTGTTTAAGGNILFAAEKEVGGKRQVIIGAALGQFGKPGVANIDEVTGVVRGLIESGQQALTAKTIVKKGDVVGRVDDGLGGTTPVVATKDVSAVGWAGLTVKLALDGQKGQEVPHSAKAGTVVGVLSVGDGKNDAVEVPVALQSDLTEPGFGAKIKRVA